MGLPTTDEEWVHYLARRHDAEKPELEALDDYYENAPEQSYMHPDLFREVSDRIKPVVIAWPELIVDSVEERLDIEGFRRPDQDEGDDDLWRVWQENDCDEKSQMAHVDALVMRRSYVAVGANEDDADTPLITAESPLEVYADIDPRTRQVRAALRRVADQDSYTQILDRYATLYLPDATVWFEWQNGWKATRRDDHKLGVVPIVPITNRPRLRARRTNLYPSQGSLRYGASELSSILPLADAANKIATDMMLAAEFVALPLRGLWGVGPEDLKDAAGNNLTALQVIMGRLLTIPVEGGREFQFQAASLSNFHESLNNLAKLVASIAGLPPHYLGYATDNPASADAIRSSEARLVKRAERKQRSFGGSWEQVMRLVRRIQTGEWDPALKRLEVEWRDASTPTTAQAADAAVKLHAAGITTLRQARKDLGYSDAQIKMMEEEDAGDSVLPPSSPTAVDKLLGPRPTFSPQNGMPMSMPPAPPPPVSA
jgi:hypothetical protein